MDLHRGSTNFVSKDIESFGNTFHSVASWYGSTVLSGGSSGSITHCSGKTRALLLVLDSSMHLLLVLLGLCGSSGGLVSSLRSRLVIAIPTTKREGRSSTWGMVHFDRGATDLVAENIEGLSDS